MRAPQARTIANVLVATAGLAAAYVVVTTPPLRRLVMRASHTWLGSSVSVYLLTQVRQAWVESRRAA